LKLGLLFALRLFLYCVRHFLMLSSSSSSSSFPSSILLLRSGGMPLVYGCSKNLKRTCPRITLSFIQ
jgi:hypothetical protein